MYSLVATAEMRTRRPIPRPPTWAGIVAAILLVAALPVALWAVANPVPGAVVAGTVGSVVVTAVVERLTARTRDDGAGSEEEPLAPVRSGALRTHD
jgi:dolichol kinase